MKRTLNGADYSRCSFTQMLWVALLILVSLDLSASQHEYVRLLKPPSRIAENDVFIKRNAESPCPTIKTIKDNKTNIMIDDQYEIVWLNPNNIQGENRIELLNSNMQLLTLLNPILNQNYSNNNGISNINVQIPNSPCVNCIIRLVQSTADGDFQMISCADVDIVESISENKACYGNECLVECTTNEQCRKGICVQGACYCESGNYGINCSKESKILPSELNVDTFSSISPNSRNSLSWKIEQGNITIVLKFPVNAWTALGLRSLADHQKCSLLDTINKEFITTELLPTNSNKLVSEIVSNSSNHGGPIGICGENEQFSHCPELNRECEPSCDWTAFPESIPTCPRSCGTPRCVCKEGYVRIGNSKEACVPFNYCQAEIKVECQRNETWAKCGQACEPSCETMYDTTPCNTTCRNASCTCQDNYVRYNGKCIYWGDCPNLEQRLLTPSDHKSIENLTINVPPKEESFKVAEEVYTSTTIATLQDSKSQKPTLSQTNEIMHCALNETINECGKVCEADCVSIFIRDECKECGTPACSCIQGYARNNGACVYWGDCPLDISNLQSSLPIKALEEKTSIPNVQSTDGSITTIEFTTNPPKHSLENAELYNKTDSAEYISKNIQTNVSDVSGDYCYGEWRYPSGCKICDYKISWNFVEETDEIEFSLETKLNQNSWTGIGFSSLGGMRDADLIIVKSFNGKISLHDMYSNSYDVPAEDFENNILTPNIIGSHVDGVLRAQFTRKRDTGDRRMDHKFSDKKCYKFLFPVSGGKLDKNGQILKHEIVPIVTKQLVCIKSCQESPKNDDKFQEGSCSNEYKHPNGCELGKCEYTARWEYNSSRREVYFEITSHGVGRWTGIGFSKTGKMENSDIYTGWVYGSKSFVIDRFAYGRQLPAIDPADRQDIYDIGGKLEDDYQTIWFKRKIVTPDQTTDFRLDECYYFMFPVGGGRVLARKGQDFQNAKTPIGYHDLYAPKVSQTKICICDENNKPIGFNDITPTAIRKRREAIPSDPFAENDMSDLSSNNSPVKNKEILLEEDPFACSDVIVAKVLDDGHSRVVDAFSLTKTGLEPDEFFGGKQTFTDIFASVINGIATVTIKRPAFSSDLADYSFKHEKTQLFWANGPIGAKSVKLNEAVSVESMIIDFYNSTKTNAPIVNSKSTTIMQTSSSPPQLDATSTLKTPLEVMHTTDTPTTLMEKMPQQTEPILTSGQFSSESEEELSHLLAVSKDPFIETSTIEMDHCYGYYNYPDNCQSDCSYQVDWRSDGSNVMFRLHAILYPEMWTGIGFSNDGTMINSDAVIVSLYKDGSVAVTDQFASSYGRPQVDQLQDIFDISTQYSNGHLWANFSRSLMTEDNNDLNLLDCLYFVFIQSGGQLEGGTAEIRKHLETPIHSASRICLNSCGGKNNFTSSSSLSSSPSSSSSPSTTTATTTTTLGATKSLPVQTTRFAKKDKEKILLSAGTLQVPPLNPPNRIAYDVIIRLLNKEYSPEFDDIDSQKSKILSQEIKKELSTLIRARWPTLESINILKFAKGSILSLIRLEFNGTNSEQLPKEDEIEEFLKAAAKEQIGSLTIDPLKLKVQRNLQSETDDKWAPLRDIRNWAIVGAALLLLTIIVLLLLCCSFRKSKRRIQPDPLSFSPPVHHGYPSYSVPEANSESTNQNLKNKANVNMLKKGQSAQNGDNNSPNSSNISEPNGIGNCTYQEWFTKVASKDTNSHIQENTYGSTMANARPMSRTSAQSSMTPYVSYPYDPVGYYTLNGEHRLPPPAYYRHY